MQKYFQQFSWLLCGIFSCSSVISCANVDNASFSTVSPSNISSSDVPPVDPMALSLELSGSNASYPKSLASYDDFKTLVTKVESVRESRLIDAKNFVKMAKEPNTMILDTRSANFFASAHIKGAINLPFTEFTQSRLAEVIPNTETRILIYCNNNFADNPVNFPSKVVIPVSQITNRKQDTGTDKIITGQKPVMLALNIPTYINLYGYGYQDIYELDELVRISSKVIEIESSEGK